MDKRLFAWALLLCNVAVAAPPTCGTIKDSAGSNDPSAFTGLTVGNFGISANVVDSPQGPRTYILNDPAVLGRWLQDFGTGTVWLRSEHGSSPMRLTQTWVKREF